MTLKFVWASLIPWYYKWCQPGNKNENYSSGGYFFKRRTVLYLFRKTSKRYQSNSFYRNIWEICVWLNTIAWTGYGDDVIWHNLPDSEKSSASNEFPTDYDKKELSQYPLPVFSKKIQNCSSLKKISTSDWEPKHIRSLPSYLHVSLFWILRKTS